MLADMQQFAYNAAREGAVMALWHQGYDTWDIARKLSAFEYDVCRYLRIGRERERNG